ncbi:MAG TPA: hypothetical protein VGP62_28975 [Bryobacteraceae bacterium]|nr:hypothetical protein [Bryobacteraceae bacterium]
MKLTHSNYKHLCPGAVMASVWTKRCGKSLPLYWTDKNIYLKEA